MDPNATLNEIRDFLADFDHYLRVGSSRKTLGSCLLRIAENATALDEWIRIGGYLPTPADDKDT